MLNVNLSPFLCVWLADFFINSNVLHKILQILMVRSYTRVLETF